MATARPAHNRNDSSDEQRVRAFLEQAAAVILESRTLSDARLDDVLALADHIGLTREQVSCELRLLEQRGVIHSAPWERLEGTPVAEQPSAPAPAPPGQPGRVASPPSKPPPPTDARSAEPPPVPRFAFAAQRSVATGPPSERAPPSELPAAPSPSESYRRWIHQKLAGYPSAVLATEDEEGLVGVGVHRYRLANVLAAHIVRDVATEQRLRLERDLEVASCHSTVAASGQAAADDQRLKEFFEQVAPILTQHRGINAQSRVLINAVAQQLGLSPEELDRALATLQRSPDRQEERDPRQMERRESFRRYLRRALAQLPDGIVTFRTHRRLIEAGEHFHGVAPSLIQPTINEVASEIGSRFISETQSVEHLSELIDDILAKQPVLGTVTRSRIYAEGTRWGLDPIAIDTILRQRIDQLRHQAAVERTRSRWILRLSAMVITGLLVFLAWVLIPSSWLTIAPTPPTDADIAPAPLPSPRPPDTDWWDDDLRIAVARSRTAYPDLRGDLENISSSQSWLREQAATRLAKQWLSQADPARGSRRDPLASVLVGLFVHEPSDALARQLATVLLAGALPADRDLPREADQMAALFRGCRAVAAMLAAPDLSDARAAELIAFLEETLHQRLERTTELPVAESRCAEALLRRYYQQLRRTASADPAAVVATYQLLSERAGTSLDPATRRRLDMELLAVLLPAAPDQWPAFEPMLRRAAVSSDASEVIQLLNIYRDTTDRELRTTLAGLLLQRLDVPRGSMSEDDVISAVRKSLGVTIREKEHEQWAAVAREADELLRRTGEEGADPRAALRDVVDLAHSATLACLLAQGATAHDTFEQLQTAGSPARTLGLAGSTADDERKPFVPRYPVSSSNVIQRHVGELATAKRPQQRVQLAEMIAQQAEGVPDVHPELGGRLAEYLIKPKPDEEQLRITPLIAKFARWPSVRLGWADYVERLPGPDSRLEQLLSQALGRPISLKSEADRVRARRWLLASAVADIPDAAPADDVESQLFDQAAQSLRDLYAAQANALGAPLTGSPEAQSPATILRALVTAATAASPPPTASAEDIAFWKGVPQHVTAADFVAEDDLQATILLGHLWMRVVAIRVQGARPDRALPARELAATPLPADADTVTALHQLRDVQTRLLRLWLMLQPDSTDTDSRTDRV